MTNSISGSTPYSYLDQLQGKTSARSTAPAAASTVDTGTAADKKAAAALNLPPAVFFMLKNANTDSTVSALFGQGESKNQIMQLFGESTEPTITNILTSADNNILSTGASSGLYKAALNAAATRKATGFSGDYISKVLDAYHAVINQNNPRPNKVSVSG